MDVQLDSLTQLVLNQGFQYLGKIVAYGGGIAAIAYAIFRLSAIKWLDSHFAKKIEELKHAHAQELKEVELRINSLFDRRKRFHDKEYEVLPEAWGKITDAYRHAVTALSPFGYYPNLERMSEEDFNEFIESTGLSGWEKRELRAATEKSKYYSERNRLNTLGAAKQASRECYAYLSKNGIFLQPSLKEKFQKIDNLIWSTLSTYELNIMDRKDGIIPSQKVSMTSLQSEADPLFAELEAIVQGRLNE